MGGSYLVQHENEGSAIWLNLCWRTSCVPAMSLIHSNLLLQEGSLNFHTRAQGHCRRNISLPLSMEYAEDRPYKQGNDIGSVRRLAQPAERPLSMM